MGGRVRRVRRSPGKVYSAVGRQNWLQNDAGAIDEAAVSYLDAAVVFDNKPLEAGHVYCVS